MISIENLVVKYHKDFASVCNVSLKIEHGEEVILFGMPESGKSSLIRVLAKLQKPTSGLVTINKLPIQKVDYKKGVSVGYLSGSGIFFKNKTVEDNLRYILKIRKVDKEEIDKKVEIAIEKYGLTAVRKQKVKTLSYLDKIKLAIARLSTRNIELLLVDDIYFGLEIDEQKIIADMVKTLIGENTTSVMAISQQKVATWFTGRVVKMDKGVVD